MTNRRKELEGLIRAAELFSSQEDRDFAIVTEILKVSHTTEASLGDAQTKALTLADTHNKTCQHIENTRGAAKTVHAQFESDPGAPTTKENMSGLWRTLI